MDAILLLYVGVGLLMVVVSVPLIKQKVKPNGLYGFRVPQTLNDPDVWYAVNAHFGRRLLLTGIGTALAALVFYYVPSIDVDTYAWASLAVFSIVFGVGLVQSWRYMRSLAR